MRLVCDKCSAVYTVDDQLVGKRDFSVACKGCAAQLTVRASVQVSAESGAPSVGEGARSAPAAGRPALAGDEVWYASIAGKDAGPFELAELSRMLDDETMAWSTPVWRDGFNAWRPARRDPALVTGVAAARGNAGDTMRLDAVKSFVADDTIVETRAALLDSEAPPAPASAEEPAPALGGAGMPASGSDTQTLDMGQHLPPTDGAPPSKPPLPPVSSSQPPLALSNPQNAAFRAGLGMPPAPLPAATEVSPVGPEAASEPSEARASMPPRTLGDAFRSAPALMRSISGVESASDLPAGAQGSLHGAGQESWVPRPKSMALVATLAFSAGLVVAALWAHFAPSRSAVTAAAPTAESQRVGAGLVAAPEVKEVVREGVSRAANDPAAAPKPSRDLPDPDELRNEVRRVAPLVKRCIVNVVVGVDVDIYLDGPSGRVRDVQVRSPKLPGGRLQCVNHAVRQMQLAPFTRPELRLMHKFSW